MFAAPQQFTRPFLRAAIESLHPHVAMIGAVASVALHQPHYLAMRAIRRCAAKT
ncbi:hypothetical protein NYR97_01605 [Xanthomonas hydrangeae]|uniref:Uncharacterized protein n=1 Tax=Xanthomonas hydrangeae TaxID=2775159 RepID=A0AAU0BAR1_9XANT|nr:hypothetical protein [Xanthomonas hydrangeae]WOB50145.1 hypothetical protein NYR97_01605 [Xanthomonas hydrangeae]